MTITEFAQMIANRRHTNLSGAWRLILQCEDEIDRIVNDENTDYREINDAVERILDVDSAFVPILMIEMYCYE